MGSIKATAKQLDSLLINNERLTKAVDTIAGNNSKIVENEAAEIQFNKKEVTIDEETQEETPPSIEWHQERIAELGKTIAKHSELSKAEIERLNGIIGTKNYALLQKHKLIEEYKKDVRTRAQEKVIESKATAKITRDIPNKELEKIVNELPNFDETRHVADNEWLCHKCKKINLRDKPRCAKCGLSQAASHNLFNETRHG